MTNLEQSSDWILDALSVKLKFSLTLTFYLIKTENIPLSKDTIFDKKNATFCIKNYDISKIKEVLVLKTIFYETAYVCILLYQTSSFYHNPNEF